MYQLDSRAGVVGQPKMSLMEFFFVDSLFCFVCWDLLLSYWFFVYLFSFFLCVSVRIFVFEKERKNIKLDGKGGRGNLGGVR